MARPTIANLRMTAERRYWPSRSKPGTNGEHFETVSACRAEDRFRRHSTLSVVHLGDQLGLFDRRLAKRLANRLDYERRGKRPPQALSSSSRLRRLRDPVFSQVHRLVVNCREPVTTFTVIKRGWEFKPKQLLHVDIKKLLAGFLSDLNRRGATEARGWLIAFLHGEYETPAGVFRLHLHGVAAGDMIAVVDRLRKGAKYKSEPGDAVRFRIRVARKPLTNLPHSVTYCFKGYWPWKHVIVGASGKRRTRRHKRIPEPYHALVLLFLDRHPPSNFVVLKYLHVAGGRLKMSRGGEARC